MEPFSCLYLPNGIPSDTPGRVFARLDVFRFEEGFRDRVQAVFEPTDDRSVRVSHVRGRDLGLLHPVSPRAHVAPGGMHCDP